MKPLLFLATVVAFSLGCMSGKDKDEPEESDADADADADADSDADSDADADADEDLLIIDAGWECTSSACTWEVVASDDLGDVALWLAETGDESGMCEGHPNCSDEGFWTEYHDDFSGSGDTKTIVLELVSFPDFSDDKRTLFDMNEGVIADHVTFYFLVEAASGGAGDCIVGGHDPGYFSDDCTNEF